MKRYLLVLYVAGTGDRAQRAIAGLRTLCEAELKGECEIEIVDVLEHPELAERAHILATPTVIRHLPLPIRRFVGDLSSREKMLVALEITCRTASVGRAGGNA